MLELLQLPLGVLSLMAVANGAFAENRLHDPFIDPQMGHADIQQCAVVVDA